MLESKMMLRATLVLCGRVGRAVPRALTATLAGVGFVSLMATTACYTYTSRAPTDVSPGQMVTVTLNNVGRVAVTADVGDDVASVEGPFISASDTSVRVHVTKANFMSGATSPLSGVDVAIPRNGINELAQKQFSRAKTGLVVGGLAALIIAAIASFGLGGLGGSSGDPKPTPTPPGTS